MCSELVGFASVYDGVVTCFLCYLINDAYVVDVLITLINADDGSSPGFLYIESSCSSSPGDCFHVSPRTPCQGDAFLTVSFRILMLLHCLLVVAPVVGTV